MKAKVIKGNYYPKLSKKNIMLMCVYFINGQKRARLVITVPAPDRSFGKYKKWTFRFFLDNILLLEF